MTYDKVSQLRKMMNQQKSMDRDDNNRPDGAENSPESATDSVFPDEAGEPPADDFTSLKQQIDELKAQLSEQKDAFLRRSAEYDNSRKRLEKDKDEAVKYANEKILQDIFPVLDSLEMTLAHAGDRKDDPIVSGVELVLKQFYQVLNKYGLEEISGVGDPFNPNLHEAISSEPSTEFESGRVTRVHRKGYKLKDRLIRAALVSVSQ